MSEKAISLTAAEWEALEGLPWMQFKLYLVLRWYMNVANQRVGEVRGISLQSLCEELYVEPAPGRTESGSPTKKAVRNALSQLEKHGLAQPCGNGEVLVFFLPKAVCVSARQKTNGHKRGTASGHASGHGETPAAQGFQDDMGHVMGHSEKPLKGHTSEVRVNPLSVEAPSAARETELSPAALAGLLALPLQAAQVAEWIRLHERQRGLRAKVVSSDQRITDWIAAGITPDELQDAMSSAVTDRVVTKNPSPLNVSFLNFFVQRVLDARKVSRGGGMPRPRFWWDDEAGIKAKAAEVGIESQEGDTPERLRSRVELELIIREEAERQKRIAQRKRKEEANA